MNRTFYTISDSRHANHLLQQTKDLLHSEWKNDANRFPEEKQIDEEPLPSHRIIFKTEPYSIWNQDIMVETVLAHVCLTASRRALSPQRLRIMLQVHKNPSVVKNVAKRAGINLNEDRFQDEEGNLTLDALTDADFVKEVNIGSLVVAKASRRRGFAKLLLSESVLFVHSKGYTKVTGLASQKLVQFYERLGGLKDSQSTQTVNSISREIDEDMLSRRTKQQRSLQFLFVSALMVDQCLTGARH